MLRPRRLDSILDAVGDTPLFRLRKLERDTPGVELYAKLEFMNPGGSVKDRAARQIFLDAVGRGELTPDRVLIDSTSGNTGVAYSLVGAALGYRVALVMPSNVTQARKDITQAFGPAGGLRRRHPARPQARRGQPRAVLLP
jgi:cysteine synthase B